MNVENYIKNSSCKVLVAADLKREILHGYAGDFLSHVMGSAKEGSIWFTVMANVNVAAVAHLADIAVVVICESVKADETLIARCKEQRINLLSTSLTVYQAALEFASI